MNRLKSIFTFALMLVGLAVVAQEPPFEPIPAAEKPRYRFDFARHFFETPEAEKAARPRVEAAVVELEKMKGKVAASPENLLKTMQLNDEAIRRLMRHGIYLFLRYATNTKDSESLEAQSRLFADFNRRTSFLQQELMEIDARKFEQFARRRPALKPYGFAVETARRLKPHTLSLKEEELLSALAPDIGDWQGELYQKLIDRTDWPDIETPTGKLDVYRDQNALFNNPDRAVREAGYKKRYEGLKENRDLYAFAITKQVKARDEAARLRRYRDYPHEAHFALYLDTKQVKDLYERIADQGEFNKRYQRLRADRIKQISGFDDVNVWDLTVIPPGQTRPRFSIDQARKAISDALAPLGADYARELSLLFDPAQGRLDIVPGENRYTDAFAYGFPGSQVGVFFSFNFAGFYSDVSTLAHEAGHVVHYELMAGHKVLPPYASGPTYFTESFAMLNELLTADYLYRNETDTFRKTYFLEQFLQNAMASFGVTRQAHIEQAVYDAVESGKAKTADDLDALAQSIGTRYSIWFEKHPEPRMEWIDVHHFYTSPMYYVNYVYANFLALKYYQMYTVNRDQFVPRFVEMVRGGFDDTPSNLLKRHLGIDLQDPKLVSDAFAVLEEKIAALQELYRKHP